MTDESQPYIPPNAFEVIRRNRKNPPCGEVDYFTSDETRNFKLLVREIRCSKN
jgi:hypothetical protein